MLIILNYIFLFKLIIYGEINMVSIQNGSIYNFSFILVVWKDWMYRLVDPILGASPTLQIWCLELLRAHLRD